MAKITQSTTCGQYHMLLTATYQFDAVAGIQAWEVGRRATDCNGITDNGQTQLVPISGGMLEADIVPSGTSGGWADTGCRFSTFVTSTLNTENIYYIRDTNGALSVKYIELNGVTCPIPASLQHIAGASLGWSNNEFVAAFQPDANTTGGTFDALVTMTVRTW